MARILVVDDDPAIRRTLYTNLFARGYDVVAAETGEEAVHYARESVPDLVVLDLMLPGLSGLQVCEILRSELASPILVLSAHGEEHLKVRALDLGADDYLTKPFGMGELLARVRALLRRQQSEPDKPRALVVGDLEVDLDARRATWRGAELDLTRRELEILAYMMRRPGQVVTHRMLLEAIWGPEYEAETHYVRVFMNRLRGKIEADPSHPSVLVTVSGVGYRLELAAAEHGNSPAEPAGDAPGS